MKTLKQLQESQLLHYLVLLLSKEVNEVDDRIQIIKILPLQLILSVLQCLMDLKMI
jgi:hypothetical protein